MIQRVPGSFRDPHGFVYRRDGVLYRQVNPAGTSDYDRLMDSGLYAALVDEGLLVRHQEVDVAAAAEPGAYRVLRPEPVPFVSYPYEWCPGQLRAAALATLRVLELALDHGMTLRDASAYNIQLVHGRPVCIDTLSFGELREGEPWVAYRQFCQHFLGPLALACLVDVRLLGLLRAHLDGIPLDLAAALLPARTRLRPALAIHLHAHAKTQQRHAADRDARAKAQGRFSLQAFRGLVDSLRGAVSGLEWEPTGSAWVDYYAAGESYAADAAAAKEELVAAVLADVGPATVWDLGANTGRFSRLAAKQGADVVAFELDPAAVEASWRQVVTDGEQHLLPLVCDLANPSPGLGWACTEREAFVDRGPADLVLALALVHHLAIAGNVPLPRIAELCARLGRSVLVEWVPKHDPMVERLLATREDVFDDYASQAFEAAVAAHFDIARREPVPGSARVLYLLNAT